jgi:hypothetical protein
LKGAAETTGYTAGLRTFPTAPATTATNERHDGHHVDRRVRLVEMSGYA